MEGKDGTDWKEIGIYFGVTFAAVTLGLIAHNFVQPHINALVHGSMTAKDAALATEPASVLAPAAAAATAAPAAAAAKS